MTHLDRNQGGALRARHGEPGVSSQRHLPQHQLRRTEPNVRAESSREGPTGNARWQDIGGRRATRDAWLSKGHDQNLGLCRVGIAQCQASTGGNNERLTHGEVQGPRRIRSVTGLAAGRGDWRGYRWQARSRHLDVEFAGFENKKSWPGRRRAPARARFECESVEADDPRRGGGQVERHRGGRADERQVVRLAPALDNLVASEAEDINRPPRFRLVDDSAAQRGWFAATTYRYSRHGPVTAGDDRLDQQLRVRGDGVERGEIALESTAVWLHSRDWVLVDEVRRDYGLQGRRVAGGDRLVSGLVKAVDDIGASQRGCRRCHRLHEKAPRHQHNAGDDEKGQ